MTELGIICWASYSIIVLYGTFKQFKLPKELIVAICLVVLSYVIPVFSFWGNSSEVNFSYMIYFFIITMSVITSFLLKRTHKMVPFFLGVAMLFLLFWVVPGLLPYRKGWNENGGAILEGILGVPLHHSTLFPIITSIILLFKSWHPSLWVFKWASRNSSVYPFAVGILTFAMTSQIPEILKYGTPWW